MPAPDRIHDMVRNALVKDGWTITADPYLIEYEDARVFADLGAEQSLAAQRADRNIVVEVKSFIGPSLMREFEVALGPYLIYRTFLEMTAPERSLYLAISNSIHGRFFGRKAIQVVVQRYQVALLVVNVDTEEVVQWTS